MVWGHILRASCSVNMSFSICLLFPRAWPAFQKELAYLPWVFPTRLYFKVKYFPRTAVKCFTAPAGARFYLIITFHSKIYFTLTVQLETAVPNLVKKGLFSVFIPLMWIYRQPCPENCPRRGTVQQYIWPIPGVIFPTAQHDWYSKAAQAPIYLQMW